MLRSAIGGLVLATVLVGCDQNLDARGFQRRIERAYMETHPGWTIGRRTDQETTFVRGDQIDVLPVADLYQDYEAFEAGSRAYFRAWKQQQSEEVAARKRTLAQSKETVIPVIKSGSWVGVQDLGAIGPARVRDQIRPWRKELAPDVFVTLGIPEEGLGYRYASIEEVETAEEGEDAWLDVAIRNLVRTVKVDGGPEIRSDDGRLLATDLDNVDGVSGLILDPSFRKKMLDRFELSEVGAAIPIRNVLILFDPGSITARKPIRARTHQLYDTQNHPGFRGLLVLTENAISVLEPARPKKKGP